MIGKNNKKLLAQKVSRKVDYYAIKKMKFGVASVVVGGLMFLGLTHSAHASDTINNAVEDTVKVVNNDEKNSDKEDQAVLLDNNTSENQSIVEGVQDTTLSKEEKIETQPVTESEVKTNLEVSEATTKESEKVQSEKEEISSNDNVKKENTPKTVVETNPDFGSGFRKAVGSKIKIGEGSGQGDQTTTAEATPTLSDPDGATLTRTENQIMEGYAGDPDKQRLTLGITDLANLGTETSLNKHYYLTFSRSLTDINDKNVLVRLVDKETGQEVERQLLDANSTERIPFKTLTGLVAKDNVSSPVTAGARIDYVGTGENSKQRVGFSVSKQNPNTKLISPINVSYVYSPMAPQLVSVNKEGKFGQYAGNGFYVPKEATHTTKYVDQDTNQELAHYTLKGLEGDRYTISNARQFDGYELVKSPEEKEKTGILFNKYPVGTVFPDGTALYVQRYKTILDEHGRVKIDLYARTKLTEENQTVFPQTPEETKALGYTKVFETTVPIDPDGGRSKEGQNLNRDMLDPREAEYNPLEYGKIYKDGSSARVRYEPLVTDPKTGKTSWVLYYAANMLLTNDLPGYRPDATYYYRKQGKVVVNYVDLDGNVIKPEVTDIEKVNNGTAYNTSDLRVPTITTSDNKLYAYKKVDKTSAPEQGEVETAVTKNVIYVYDELKGNVEVYFKDDKGQELKTKIPDTTNASNGTAYDTKDYKEETLLVGDKTYKLIKTEGSEIGEVVGGQTIKVTYIYKLSEDVIVPVTPDNPQWPEGIEHEALTENVQRTIHYKYLTATGDTASDDVVQNLPFKRNALVNVTKGTVEYSPWNLY